MLGGSLDNGMVKRRLSLLQARDKFAFPLHRAQVNHTHMSVSSLSFQISVIQRAVTMETP